MGGTPEIYIHTVTRPPTVANPSANTPPSQAALFCPEAGLSPHLVPARIRLTLLHLARLQSGLSPPLLLFFHHDPD